MNLSSPPEEEEESKSAEEQTQEPQEEGTQEDAPLPQVRATSLYGDVNEENAREVVYSLLVLGETPEPFDFYVSTKGGTTADMFAIYDIMRRVRENSEIHTYGIGKVMSAGVLILAAGTTGKRKIGKNCRLMLHPAQTGFEGSSNRAKQHVSEIKLIENLYLDSLVEETDGKLTKSYLKKLIKNDTNVYFNAEEAVKKGIADIIV
jgi:ATP-dependent Clp endopeptidase proteolytic subunit ClpP